MANQEMQGIARDLERESPDTNAGWSAAVKPLQEQVVGNIRPTLVTLLGAVCFVLLIACTNVANLLLARSSGRGKEIAVRTALGASRWRMVRQLLTESMALALISGALGLGLAYVGVRALATFAPGDIPRLDEIAVDGRVLAFTFGIAALTGLLFGLAPAASTARIQLNEVLKAAGRSSMATLRSRRLRSSLIVCEIALSVVLLIGATLMIRTFFRLQAVDPGFRPDHVLTMRVAVPEKRYDGLRLAQFYRQLLDRVQSLPGVQAAALARDVPLTGTDPSLNFIVEHRPALASSDQPRAKYRAVSADYFKAMGIRLIRGRVLTSSDNERSPAVAVINEALARQFFPGEDPLGKRIQSGFEGSPWCTIIGIVADVKHAALNAPTAAETYYAYTQVPPALMGFVEGTMTLVVRSTEAPGSLARAVSAQLQALDSEEAVFKVTSMDQLVEASMAQPRLRMYLMGVFAAVALVLAATGLYGVISYSVSQRSNEMGIRAALGAEKSDLFKLVLGEGARLAAVGAAIGLIAAFLLARTLSKLLFGVKAYDPATFLGVTALLLAVAALASYVPARRATRVDPNVVLRYE
jgi:putative ABC transport system permease protein